MDIFLTIPLYGYVPKNVIANIWIVIFKTNHLGNKIFCSGQKVFQKKFQSSVLLHFKFFRRTKSFPKLFFRDSFRLTILKIPSSGTRNHLAGIESLSLVFPALI